ncbi:VRR-NUC domain protein [Ancylostoma ceylanicum]|uniref:Fanconi-associated nuclease n=1 Tax=Ancylostoma ceylanicum TaxID=53326 RepID=A0A0D6M570_9BILA|nr:VRR-NUC domain protein [Ancylostoma ceylanicum]
MDGSQRKVTAYVFRYYSLCYIELDKSKSDRSEFTRSITWLETAVDYELEDVVRSTWCAQNLQETSEINWELFQSVDDFLEFLFCCPRSGLLAVIRRVITDYCNCRSGFPDLTTWNTKTKKVAVVELKGSGDRLSTKQRLWLDYFMRHKIRAEVCHVIGDKRQHEVIKEEMNGYSSRTELALDAIVLRTSPNSTVEGHLLICPDYYTAFRKTTNPLKRYDDGADRSDAKTPPMQEINRISFFNVVSVKRCSFIK